MPSLRLRFLLSVAIGAGVMLVSEVSYGLEGKVIDGSTGKPLAGVYVIGAWQINIGLPGKSISGCSKLEVVRTDEQGRFALSTWSGSILAHLFGDENLNDYYYLAGYRWEKGRPISGESVVLVPDTRTAIRQLDRIGELMEKADCGSAGSAKGEGSADVPIDVRRGATNVGVVRRASIAEFASIYGGVSHHR